ncbi:hypothetical protein PV409_22110 [Streptomyces sp. ME02-6979.5a]|uniref:hypothetical protein n=1 Tax=Streptomyces sp. ME02-6979.5a TaxID=462925 RepID=UPI0029A341AD|nr:hypothetical protein [Streptomyces sp. ME02-6979.5a]MDX3340655.1 hypothetical protein [Streptomyces sp. ME02-6979.5a]
MTWRTVKALADAASPEELLRGQWQGRPSVLNEYKPYLDDRWSEGCTNAWKLCEEIVPLGYKGNYQRVSAYLRQKRTSPRPVTAQPPSPRTVAGWILRRPTALSETEQLELKTVLAHCRPAQPPRPRRWHRPRPGCRHCRTHPALEFGVVEGHVNRIKILKRQMFGRAGFQLLRKHVLLA